MYDINTKVIKKGYKLFGIFLAAGILFFGIFIFIIISNKNKKNNMDASVMSYDMMVLESYSDEGNILYSPVYYYKVDGREFSCPSNSSSSIKPSGNKLVYYDTKNPSNCISEYSMGTNKILIFFMIVPILFIVIAILQMRKINKRVKLVNDLNEKGKLVKGLPYSLEDTGTVVNGNRVQRLVVNYTLSSGVTVTLKGDPRYDYKTADADGLVDIIIDENNPDNYFIDFEINRLTGNTPSDFYQNPNVAFAQPQAQNNAMYQTVQPQVQNNAMYQTPQPQVVTPQVVNTEVPTYQNINQTPTIEQNQMVNQVPGPVVGVDNTNVINNQVTPNNIQSNNINNNGF